MSRAWTGREHCALRSPILKGTAPLSSLPRQGLIRATASLTTPPHLFCELGRCLMALAAFALLIGGCASHPPEPVHLDSTASTRQDDATASMKAKADMKTEALASDDCTTLSCLEDSVGAVVTLRGRYEYPQQIKFAQTVLRLDDGTRVILRAKREGAFAADNDGRVMRITGVVYTDQIPEHYRIIGRTPDPHMVEISDVEVLK